MVLLYALARPILSSGMSSLGLSSVTAKDPPCNDITPSRTLFSILSSCFSVIFICVWVAIHPNVPNAKHSSYRVLFDKFSITFLALLAPELMVIWALRQWVSAQRILQKYKKYGWTKRHVYLALMRGFALYDKEGFVLHLWDPEFNDFQGRRWSWYTERHGQYLAMVKEEWKTFSASPFWTSEQKNPQLDSSSTLFNFSGGQDTSYQEASNPFAGETNEQLEMTPSTAGSRKSDERGGLLHSPDAQAGYQSQDIEDFECLLELFAAKGFITISEEEIMDNLNHTDWVTKAIAVVQTGWFVSQYAARTAERIAITQLEVLTLAFALLNFATYLLWWSKPQGVRHPVCVYWPVPARLKVVFSQKNLRILDWDRVLPVDPSWLQKYQWGNFLVWIIGIFFGPISYLFLYLPSLALAGKSLTEDVDDNLFDSSLRDTLIRIHIATCFMVSIFGCIHLLAWSFSFHTPLERHLWWMFALAITVQPILSVVTIAALVILLDIKLNHSGQGKILNPFAYFFLLAYAACRIGLIVLALMELRDLPGTAYQAVQ
ncbi:hypothetical protein GYMLUDRAFT_257878 [Collybiopsis luxurians FD-317 M1]|nr:hypothetical protein GYMLUDRAFT_257878 [Collybiopsis luxurians FD-317 M1]